MEAIALGAVVSSLLTAAPGCGRARSGAKRPAADTVPAVTVSVPPRDANRLIDRLLAFAARNRWTLSVRTDSAAARDADLVISDSAGRLVARVRPGSPVVARARQLSGAAGVPAQ
jgi:hypothetical protein